MQEMQLSQSVVKEENNQFLQGSFNYENCPFCQRSFFVGKLQFHLKLCNQSNPMSKSPLRKTKRGYLPNETEKQQSFQFSQNKVAPNDKLSPQIKFKKCIFCKNTFSISLFEKHLKKCTFKPNLKDNYQIEINPQLLQSFANPVPQRQIKSKTKIEFQFERSQRIQSFQPSQVKQPSSALPRIRNSAKEKKINQRKYISQDLKQLSKNYTVRIRQDLSCFKKALQVQQIVCEYCNRKFSKQAALRHIPICEKLKNQEMYQVIFKKHSKSQVYKLSNNVQIKKNTLFRSKLIVSNHSNGNMVEKEKSSEDLEIKSARVMEPGRLLHSQAKIQKKGSSIVKKRKFIVQEKLSVGQTYMNLKQINKTENIQRTQQNKIQKQIKEASETVHILTNKGDFNDKDISNQENLSQKYISKHQISAVDSMNMTFSKDLNKNNSNKQQKTTKPKQSQLIIHLEQSDKPITDLKDLTGKHFEVSQHAEFETYSSYESQVEQQQQNQFLNIQIKERNNINKILIDQSKVQKEKQVKELFTIKKFDIILKSNKQQSVSQLGMQSVMKQDVLEDKQIRDKIPENTPYPFKQETQYQQDFDEQ